MFCALWDRLQYTRGTLFQHAIGLLAAWIKPARHFPSAVACACALRPSDSRRYRHRRAPRDGTVSELPPDSMRRRAPPPARRAAAGWLWRSRHTTACCRKEWIADIPTRAAGRLSLVYRAAHPASAIARRGARATDRPTGLETPDRGADRRREILHARILRAAAPNRRTGWRIRPCRSRPPAACRRAYPERRSEC